MQNRTNVFYLIKQIMYIVHWRNNCVQVYWRSKETKKEMGKSKKETIEMPITEAPRKAGGALENAQEVGAEKKKKNLKTKLIRLKDYDGPRYMQANTLLRRYLRFTKMTTIINTNINVNSKTIIIINIRFCFDWCCTDLNRPWPPMAESQVREQ